MKVIKIPKIFVYMCLSAFIFFTISFKIKSSDIRCTEYETILKQRMKGPLSAFDENLIREVAENHLIPPSSKDYHLSLNDKSSEAQKYNNRYRQHPNWQYLQDETRFLFPKNSKNGFFIEVGAFDGEFFSNSLFLEMEYGWNGLLIEPDKGLYQSLLRKNRKAWSSNCCLSSKPYPHETLLKVIDSSQGSVTSLYGRIYNSISESRTYEDRSNFGIPVYETVQCIPLNTLLLALNQTHVDLIYLDVEDVEVDVLNNFAWDKINVDVWIIEHRNPNSTFGVDVSDSSFAKWFESKGHILYKESPYVLDYIFIKENSNYFKENYQRLKLGK